MLPTKFVEKNEIHTSISHTLHTVRKACLFRRTCRREATSPTLFLV